MDFNPSPARLLPEKLWRVYLILAACVLLLAGVAKSIGLQQEAAFLTNPNSLVVFLTNRQLLTGVAVVEIAVAVLLFSRAFTLETKVKMVFWLSLQFAIYRASLALAREPAPCKCFGDIFGWMGMGEDAVRNMTSGLFWFLLIPSAAWVLANQWAKTRGSSRSLAAG